MNFITHQSGGGIKGAAFTRARVCSVQCEAVRQTECVCVSCCVALASAAGRFIVAVSWPLRRLLHVKVNGENCKVILFVCLVCPPPQATAASQGPSERRPAGGRGLPLGPGFTLTEMMPGIIPVQGVTELKFSTTQAPAAAPLERDSWEM